MFVLSKEVYIIRSKKKFLDSSVRVFCQLLEKGGLYVEDWSDLGKRKNPIKSGIGI